MLACIERILGAVRTVMLKKLSRNSQTVMGSSH